jgi:hypothetical protein
MTPATSLSPEVAELAARHELGALVGTFAPQRLNRLISAMAWLTIVSMLLAFVIPGLVFLWLLRRLPEFNRKQAAKRLHLFEEGMIVNPPQGDGMIVLRWDSIRLYQDIVQTYVNGAAAYKKYAFVALGKGSSTTVTEFFERPETWGAWMQDAVLRAQGPQALASVLDGQTVSFGDFTLSRTGITTTRNGHLAWPQVQEVELRAGRVRVIRTGDPNPWSTEMVSKVANLQIFLALVQNLSTAD